MSLSGIPRCQEGRRPVRCLYGPQSPLPVMPGGCKARAGQGRDSQLWEQIRLRRVPWAALPAVCLGFSLSLTFFMPAARVLCWGTWAGRQHVAGSALRPPCYARCSWGSEGPAGSSTAKGLAPGSLSPQSTTLSVSGSLQKERLLAQAVAALHPDASGLSGLTGYPT